MSTVPSLRLQRSTAVALQVAALLLFALHLYVRLCLPPSAPNSVPDPSSNETAWWGLWPVQYLAPWQVAAGAIALLLAVYATWAAWPWRLPRPRVRQVSVLAVVTGALLAAFFLFPLAHTRWGDAFMLAKGIAWPDPALRITHSWQAPLDVFLHAQVWGALHAPLGWEDAVPAYRLLSPLAGLLYLLAALAAGRQLNSGRWPVPPWLTYGLLATLGLMQLFFGYVENYSFAAAGILAYLWLGLGVLAGRRPLWLAAALLGLTNATHPSTVILAPSLLFLGWQCWRQRNKSLLSVVGEIALPTLLIGSATFVWMEASGHGLYALFNTDRPGGGDASWFVPLAETSTRWQHYTMFSWEHLRDWLNLQFLVAPVVLPSLAVAAANLWLASRARAGAPDATSAAESRQANASIWFLVVAAGFYLLFTWVWNPDYGGQRDWDLFSLATLPATLLLAALLPRCLPDIRMLRAGVIPLLVVQGWHTSAWILQNTLPWQWPD